MLAAVQKELAKNNQQLKKRKLGNLNLGKLKSRSQNKGQNKENPSFSREKLMGWGAALRAAPHPMEVSRKMMDFPDFDLYFDF